MGAARLPSLLSPLRHSCAAPDGSKRRRLLATKACAHGHSSNGVMRIELSNGETFVLSDHEAWSLYETLLERARQRGASSAAKKLRPALAWSSSVETKVALDQFESDAVQAIRGD